MGISRLSSASAILLALLLCMNIRLCFASEQASGGAITQWPHHPNGFLQAEDSYSSSSKFHFSGEAGAALFHTGPEGEFPDSEFRVDEAKLFVEAAIWDDIYAFGEINLLTREDEEDEKLHLGELYVEFEDVSKLWNQERVLNVRAGRFDIPFGEEYLTRDAIDNPLISHSLSDFWGVDEGFELYGSLKKMEYTFAVQNGGESILHDFNPDKAATGRITYKWSEWMHFTGSAMRTGNLDVAQDKFSELWFGNGFLRLLGSRDSTTVFHANVFQGEGHLGWQRGHFHAALGNYQYDDNDTAQDNGRNVHYFQLEAIQNLNHNKEGRLYAGARFSRMTSRQGFPIVGNGTFGRFEFDNHALTTRLWRMSFGTGFRAGDHVLLKTEYSFEHGRELNGSARDRENFWGVEVAVKF